MAGERCAICYEEREGGEKSVHRLECGHRFHRGCLRDLVEHYVLPHCPLCRAPLRKTFVDFAVGMRLGITLVEYRRRFRHKHDMRLQFAEDRAEECAIQRIDDHAYLLASRMSTKWTESMSLQEAEKQLLRIKKLRRKFRLTHDGTLAYVGNQEVEGERLYCDHILTTGTFCDRVVTSKLEYHCKKHVNHI